MNKLTTISTKDGSHQVDHFWQGDSLNVTIMEALDKYDKIFVKVGLEGVRHLQPTSPWSSYVNAFFFASTVLTTVGK